MDLTAQNPTDQGPARLSMGFRGFLRFAPAKMIYYDKEKRWIGGSHRTPGNAHLADRFAHPLKFEREDTRDVGKAV